MSRGVWSGGVNFREQSIDSVFTLSPASVQWFLFFLFFVGHMTVHLCLRLVWVDASG